LWSGAIATNWTSEGGDYSNSFSISGNSLIHPYYTAMVAGIGGNRADVFNSSWGFTDPSGSEDITIALDGMMRSSGVIGVFPQAIVDRAPIRWADRAAATMESLSAR